ncbi:hypothetical protein [Streptomyces atriruber]|uniref:hypothetical protein n=1 Tax=Streptomyces atriruber TaxID=545121 RepID=UPI0006E3092B|nr:hypothetical protein [Streptomyces atriruber]
MILKIWGRSVGTACLIAVFGVSTDWPLAAWLGLLPGIWCLYRSVRQHWAWWCSTTRNGRPLYTLGARVTARLTTAVTAAAVHLAGPGRSHLYGEWLAHLEGDNPVTGARLTSHQRYRAALGFLIAALCMRTADGAAQLWRPVEWVLSTDKRLNLAITVAVAISATYLVRTDGLHAVVAGEWQTCAGLGGCLYLLARWLRVIRSISVSPRSPRNARDNSDRLE